MWYGQNEAIKGVDMQFEKNKITALIGPSGSGKSTTLISLLVQSLMWSKSEIYIVDPKNEFSAMSEFYPANRIAVEIDDVLRMLSYVCDKISSRQKIVSDGVKTHQKMGLRAYDLGL